LLIDKCTGCTNCIKRCPTEAIRVRDGKAVITTDRCIDCGECIKICPHKAKQASYDSFASIEKYKYKIALPAPALYGQFNNLDDVDLILTGLLDIGFDDVYEVSRAAEIISEHTRRYIAAKKPDHPIISTACPAIVRLIAVRFPYLKEYLLPIVPPVELAARMARRAAKKKHPELADSDIGVFFISPCPAKVSYVQNPIGIGQTAISGALSMSDVYFRLSSAMKKIKYSKPLSRSGVIGISWASSGGEAAALLNEKYLAADGIENVIKVLDEIENENFAGLDFIELNACSGGCIGGALTLENPYIAKARLQKLRKFLPLTQNRLEPGSEIDPEVLWQTSPEENSAMTLSFDRTQALAMKAQMTEIKKTLPGLDCGACGSPSCEAFAEDIVKGVAKPTDCIFKMREQFLAKGLINLETAAEEQKED
jgi:Fe-S-cluster-containing hydrogenase component 2